MQMGMGMPLCPQFQAPGGKHNKKQNGAAMMGLMGGIATLGFAGGMLAAHDDSEDEDEEEKSRARKMSLSRKTAGSHIRTPTPAEIAARVKLAAKAAPKVSKPPTRMTRAERQALNSDDEDDEMFSEDALSDEENSGQRRNGYKAIGRAGGPFRCLCCLQGPTR